MIILRTKSFTQYDDTDNLKRMKDSDILAEKKKEVPSYASSVLPKAAAGAAIGAIGLGAANAMRRGFGKGYGAPRGGQTGWAAAGKGLKHGAIGGAIIGAAALGMAAANKRQKEREANQFYNDRLEYAQKQAKRRERVDWKQNMTQREGYSF